MNSAIAAMSAVVAWKSAVDERSEAARSAGDESDVRLGQQVGFQGGGDGRRVRAIRQARGPRG